jgi:hypothetical protein
MTTAMSTVMQHRQWMVDNCNWAIEHRGEIHYAEVRPIPVHLPKFHLPFTTDCSGFVTLMAKWSGNPDPNGNGFNGQGFTGTLLDHLPHIPFQETWRGDLAVFGAHPGVHVVVLLEGGCRDSNPPVASHGEEGDPRRYFLSDEIAFFAKASPGVTYLRLRSNDT